VDPAFSNPTKFVGKVYTKDEAHELATSRPDWTFKPDGEYWRRVVPSPEPKRIFELHPIEWLLERGTVVICAGGGGIPTMFRPDDARVLVGVEAVIDKDLASERLAVGVHADAFVMATDVDGIYAEWGTPQQHRLDRVTATELRAMSFAAGSMGPKVEAAVRFVEHTGNRAAIGSLADIEKLVDGVAGTQVVPS
jgi:carbamate kinase